MTILVISGCSGSSRPAAASPPSAPAVSKAAATGSPVSHTQAAATTAAPPQSPATLTAACPFLPTSELAQMLGIDASTLTASEETPQKNSGGIQLGCDYHVGGGNPYSLSISAYPIATLSVTNLVDAVPNDAQNERKLSGIGQAAVYYTTSDGFGVLCAGTSSHGQARTATFIAPKSLPQSTFTEVVKLLVGRL